jgi:3-deoxy-7-phosphoheptulonate synthase
MLEAYNNSTITINQINNWNFYGDKTIKTFKNIYKENKYALKSQIMLSKLLDYYDNFRSEDHENFIFTSHEGLLLHYEECLLREINENFFDLSSHFLWIGERTGNINEAHIEFFRGIQNPIGIKVSSRMDFDQLTAIIKLLNPENKKGKIVLITRFGCNQVKNSLETLCNKIIEEKLEVIFMCDPNHGNTKVLKEIDKKVRYFDDMLNEILQTNSILNKNKLHLSGIHLEASSLNVTECLGGLENDVTEINHELYTTYCDPRLNMQQAYQLCDYVGKFLASECVNNSCEDSVECDNGINVEN